MSKHAHDVDHGVDHGVDHDASPDLSDRLLGDEPTDRRLPRDHPDDLVVVHGQDVRVDRVDTELPLAEARHRHGGVDPLAIVAGALAGLGATAALLALGAAAGSPALERLDDRALTISALALGLALTALAFFVAGWAAGRVARYEGGRNGLLAGLLLLVLLAALAGGASAFDAVRDVDRPSWLDTDLGPAAAIAAAGTAVLGLLLAMLGGRAGGAWHRKVDRTLLQTRSGGLVDPLGEHR